MPGSGKAGDYQTALQFLQARFPDDAERIGELVTTGQVFDRLGEPITAQTPFVAQRPLYLFRDPPSDEPEVPNLTDIQVLYRDDNLLVIDKPHQVSVIPRGRWVTHTALVYLRNLLDLPELSPLHRLDRPTAGVLAFSVKPQVRGAYQMLFQNRQVHKEYLAVTAAPQLEPLSDQPALRPNPQQPEAFTRWLTNPSEPYVLKSRIVKQRGITRAEEVPGESNAETSIYLEQLHSAQNRALWRLVPKTGKTHQLRVHMNSLGLPILGDPFWPVLRTDLAEVENPEPPLQLLAKVMEFIDPFTGEQRRFESQRQLLCWE